MLSSFKRTNLPSIGVALSFLGLMGCFSHVPFGEAPKPGGDQPAVYIYRQDTPPHLRKASVFVNEQKVGDLASEEFTWVSVPPGPYIVHVKWSPELFISTENINVVVRGNETLFVKIEPSHLIMPGASGIMVKLSSETHPDQITQIWPLKYVAPNELSLRPLQ
jgi:hypothetical protein